MQQVPYYCIIGDGRVATHMSHYFQSLDLSFCRWSRRQHAIERLPQLINNSTHALILISDDAITQFIEQHACLTEQTVTLVHFSASLICPYASYAHPLQTFSKDLYSIESYRAIPFMIDQQGVDFSYLLPGLPNPHYTMRNEDKAYYHALCVMANNFTTLLWQKFYKEMADKFNFQQQHAYPILRQTLYNLEHNAEHALTGPIARGDKNTLKKDLNALANDDFFDIFNAFVTTHLPEVNHE